MENSLETLIKKYDLTVYEPICKQLIDAYKNYPQLSECDHPESQLVRFLSRCDGVEPSEVSVRFKHQISELDVFQLRAYKIAGSCVLYFDPFNESFQKFSAGATVSFYSNLHPYPPIDVVLKHLQTI